jgi:hypothetical protein
MRPIPGALYGGVPMPEITKTKLFTKNNYSDIFTNPNELPDVGDISEIFQGMQKNDLKSITKDISKNFSFDKSKTVSN